MAIPSGAAPSAPPCSCAASSLGEHIERLIDRRIDERLEQRIEQRLAALNVMPQRYGGPNLPAGVRTPRMLHAICRRKGLSLVKVGRELYIDARAWDAAHASGPGLAPIGDADERALEALGIELAKTEGER